MIHTVVRFDDIGSMVRHAAEHGDTSGASHAVAYGDSWYGTDTWQEGLTLAQDGWLGVREQVDNLTAHLVSNIRETMRVGYEHRMSYVGGAVSMARYMRGDPRCMRRMVATEQPGVKRVTRILISTGALAGVQGESIIRRGVAVTALVELLGHAGRAVEIYGEGTVSSGGKRGNRHTILVRLKDANERLDINALMFALGHPSWHRRICWAVRESAPQSIRQEFGFTKYGGMGSSIPNPMMGDELGEDTVILPTIQAGDQWNASDSVNWIVTTLRKCGVEVEEN